MSTEKSVEEIVEDFGNHLYNGYDVYAKNHLRETLQAERTKRDEMVEEFRVMRKYLLRGNHAGGVAMGGRSTSDYYQQGQVDVLRTVIHKLTQPNNQN